MTASIAPVQSAWVPNVAAGIPPMSTDRAPGGNNGPPTWGTGGKLGVTIGHTCISVTLAAGWGIYPPRVDYYTNAEKEKIHPHQVYHEIYTTELLRLHK